MMKKVTKEISADERIAEISLFHCCAWKLPRHCLLPVCCTLTGDWGIYQSMVRMGGFTHSSSQSFTTIITDWRRGLVIEKFV